MEELPEIQDVVFEEREQEPEPIVVDHLEEAEEDGHIVIEEDINLESPEDFESLDFGPFQGETSEDDIPTSPDVKSHPLNNIDSGHLLASPGKPYY